MWHGECRRGVQEGPPEGPSGCPWRTSNHSPAPSLLSLPVHPRSPLCILQHPPESPPQPPWPQRRQPAPALHPASMCLSRPAAPPSRRGSRQSSVSLSCPRCLSLCSGRWDLCLSPGSARPWEPSGSSEPHADVSGVFLSPPPPGMSVVSAWRPCMRGRSFVPKKESSVCTDTQPGWAAGPDGAAWVASPWLC